MTLEVARNFYSIADLQNNPNTSSHSLVLYHSTVSPAATPYIKCQISDVG